MKMKIACIILTTIIVIAIMAVCVMVKFAAEINLDEKMRDTGGMYKLVRNLGVIALQDIDASKDASERFPYVAAITRNSSSTWSFACFASVVMARWIVTSAHCRQAGSTHRILLFHNFMRNRSYMYPIAVWKLHEKFNANQPSHKYDIALAKLNLEAGLVNKISTFDERMAVNVEASIWKTVSTMDKRIFLTNVFEKFEVHITEPGRCYEVYGVELDESMICIDASDHEDCFIHEFGPIYSGDKLVGVLSLKPRDCDVKVAIFTNVSYYANWIFKSSQTSYFG